MKSRVLIINTGGTICMRRTSDGYAPAREEFRLLLSRMPELQDEQMPAWDIIDLEPLVDSSNIALDDWNRIGGAVSAHYDDYDGFVILHGTDTMAYTASALSFMFENLAKPVILTGAQIPLCELRSDGKDNLVSSLLIAGGGRVCEVCIFFGNELLRGNRTTKYSSDRLVAFKSPNFPPLAYAGISIDYNDALLLRRPEKPFRFEKLCENPIGVIKVFPGIQFELFDNIMTERLRGVVIETFGSGNIPSSSSALLPIIRKAFENGTVVAVCSQCPQGTVMLGAYETSSALKKAGAVSGRNMTTEAAVAKLYYLLGKGYDTQTVCKQMETPLRGEE